MKQWQEEYHTNCIRDPNSDFTYWCMDLGEAIIPLDVDLKWYLMDIHHNHPTAGHPGHDKTIKVLCQHYFWPGLAKWIEEYIQGCTACQESKICTHQAKTLLYKIPVPSNKLLWI